MPDYTAEVLRGLDWAALEDGKISKILLDIDNTLALHGSDSPDSYAKEVVDELKKEGREVLILSNSKGKRAKKYSQALGLRFIGAAGKPFSPKMYRLKKEARFAEDTLLIGDQLFTDVLAAKYLGIKVLLVKPRSLAEETFLIKFKRLLERAIYRCKRKAFDEVSSAPKRKNIDGPKL